MIDMFDPSERSRIMAGIRSTGNQSTEVRVAAILRRSGIRGWRRNSKIYGKPDFVFRDSRIAVFVDGDFWHGNPKNFRLPKSNKGYWRRKILGNRKRDRNVNRELRRLGWRVIRFWESSLENEAMLIRRLKHLLSGRRESRDR